MMGQILVADKQGSYAIKLVGDVRMVLCLSFDTFIRNMFADASFERVIFDLREAEAVDSTTLGLMAKIALQANAQYHEKPILVVEAAGMIHLLETMGFEDIFTLSSSVDCDSCGAAALDCVQGEEANFKARVIEAHKTLMSLNEHNRNEFKQLVESLERGD